MTTAKKHTDRIEIRAVHTPVECRSVQFIQQHVWGSNDRDLVPSHMLISIANNGGILLGAFAPHGPAQTLGMVGFVLGLPGHGTNNSDSQIPKHCSHMVAVLPEYRQYGIGLRLKLAQREAVLAQGVTDWVTWTFDPLQYINAIFNLHRLGATSKTYLLNAYGDMDDALNIGLPTDRLQVDWWLRSPRVMNAIDREHMARYWELESLHVLPAPSPGVSEVLSLSGMAAALPLAVPLLQTADSLCDKDPQCRSVWLYYMREVLPAAFEHGYELIDCVNLPTAGWHYILLPS